MDAWPAGRRPNAAATRQSLLGGRLPGSRPCQCQPLAAARGRRGIRPRAYHNAAENASAKDTSADGRGVWVGLEASIGRAPRSERHRRSGGHARVRAASNIRFCIRLCVTLRNRVWRGGLYGRGETIAPDSERGVGLRISSATKLSWARKRCWVRNALPYQEDAHAVGRV